jgi:hypothetical protein
MALQQSTTRRRSRARGHFVLPRCEHENGTSDTVRITFITSNRRCPASTRPAKRVHGAADEKRQRFRPTLR